MQATYGFACKVPGVISRRDQFKEGNVLRKEKYYIQDSRQYVGNDMLWWGKSGKGYTTRLEDAQVYTLEQAQTTHNGRDTDIPWLKSYIDGKASLCVDMQYVCSDENKKISGIKLNKRKKARPTMGKTRGNCDNCAKFVWEFDPNGDFKCADCKSFEDFSSKFRQII